MTAKEKIDIIMEYREVLSYDIESNLVECEYWDEDRGYFPLVEDIDELYEEIKG